MKLGPMNTLFTVITLVVTVAMIFVLIVLFYSTEIEVETNQLQRINIQVAHSIFNSSLTTDYAIFNETELKAINDKEKEPVDACNVGHFFAFYKAAYMENMERGDTHLLGQWNGKDLEMKYEHDVKILPVIKIIGTNQDGNSDECEITGFEAEHCFDELMIITKHITRSYPRNFTILYGPFWKFGYKRTKENDEERNQGTRPWVKMADKEISDYPVSVMKNDGSIEPYVMKLYSIKDPTSKISCLIKRLSSQGGTLSTIMEINKIEYDGNKNKLCIDNYCTVQEQNVDIENCNNLNGKTKVNVTVSSGISINCQ